MKPKQKLVSPGGLRGPVATLVDGVVAHGFPGKGPLYARAIDIVAADFFDAIESNEPTSDPDRALGEAFRKVQESIPQGQYLQMGWSPYGKDPRWRAYVHFKDHGDFVAMGFGATMLEACADLLGER